MALKSLEKHADPAISESVARKGAAVRRALSDLGSMRGLGLMLGLELPVGTDGGSVIKAALKAGIITLADGPGGSVLAFAPPFCISEEEIDFAAATLGSLLS